MAEFDDKRNSDLEGHEEPHRTAKALRSMERSRGEPLWIALTLVLAVLLFLFWKHC